MQFKEQNEEPSQRQVTAVGLKPCHLENVPSKALTVP